MTRLPVVFDTNVYTSALVFGGVPGRILVSALAGVFTLCAPEIIGRELMGLDAEKLILMVRPE